MKSMRGRYFNRLHLENKGLRLSMARYTIGKNSRESLLEVIRATEERDVKEMEASTASVMIAENNERSS